MAQKCEPIEELIIDIPEHLSGKAIEIVSIRKRRIENYGLKRRFNAFEF